MPELELEPEIEPEDPQVAKDERDRKTIQAFVACIGLFFFFLPIIAAVGDYWTDLQMFFFMNDILSDYLSNTDDIRSSISTPTSTNDLFICFPDNNNANASKLYNFLTFTVSNALNTSSNDYVNCTCGSNNYSNFTSFSNSVCSSQSATDYTTSNLDTECSNGANYGNTNAICYLCDCGLIDPHDDESPQYLYGKSQFLDAEARNNDDYVRSHCSPNDLYRRVTKSSPRTELETNLTDVRNSNAAFLFLSAIWLIAYLVLAGMILFREFCRFICHFCYERSRPPINYDEITWLVFTLVMLHLFEDLPQMIISTMLSVYHLEDSGSQCVENWRFQGNVVLFCCCCLETIVLCEKRFFALFGAAVF